MLFNYPLEAAFLSIIICQFLKLPIAYLFNQTFKPELVTSTGGMPSSHSAGVSSLITAIALQHGLSSPLTAISAVFGVIVIFDSMGVRRQSGEHGILINELIDDFKELQDIIGSMTSDDYHHVSEGRQRLKEYLGHKPREVFVGILAGVLISVLLYQFI